MPTSRSVSSALASHPNRRSPKRGGISVNSIGATSRTPIASPAHQTAQVGAKPVIGTVPDKTDTALPTVALIVIPISAASTTSSVASRIRSSWRWKPARRSSSVETNGASVLPHAIRAAPSGDGPRGRLTANAARAMAGHMRRPSVRKVTRAMPVGGQIGVTWPWTRARFRLNRAAAQYANATTARGTRYLTACIAVRSRPDAVDSLRKLASANRSS